MPTTSQDDFDDENDEDDSIDREAPDESDCNDDEDETVACPYCKKSVHEHAEICHHCGSYISSEDAPMTKPAWLVMTTILVLFAMLGAGLIVWLVSRWQ